MQQELKDLGFDTDALELLRLPRPPYSSTSPIVDPEEIAREIFQTTFDLKNPAQTIAALERLFPAKDGEIVTDPVVTAAARRAADGRVKLFGNRALAAEAAATLATHAAAALDRIQPLRKASVLPRDCGHRPLLALVRASITRLTEQVAKEEPIPEAIQCALDNLKGENGYLPKLGELVGIDTVEVCNSDDEAIVTAYKQLVADTNALAVAWAAAHDAPDTSIAAKFDKLRRLLAMVRVTLIRLRAEVTSPAAWMMTIQDSTASADQVWNWALDAATKAPQLLDEGGAAALPEIHCTFEKLKLLLEKLGKDEEEDEDACAEPFQDDDAKELLEELICHVDRVVTATAPPAYK